jgi:acetylglutamate synthase
MSFSPETTPDAILRFLDSIGRRSEAEFYLALFRAESKERFANLVVDSNVLRDALEAVVLDLRFLHGLGLVPVVTLGLYSEGPRGLARASHLVSRLERAEVDARVFEAECEGLADAVAASARAGCIPIVAFSKGSPKEVPVRFDCLGELSNALRTKKLIFVTRRGGLRLKKTDQYVPFINLATDYEKLAQQKALAPKQHFLLSYARKLLLSRVEHPMLVAVTSPLQLLRELFTVKGAGTLIKRGSTVLRREGYADVDLDRLHALLTSGFGRSPIAGFFERPVARVYLEEAYRGVALVRETPLGAYLCKFAVERAAQGEGIGRDIWQLVTTDFPCLFWRARPKNPIGAFYTQECDGMARFADWHVFWMGLAPDRIADAIAFALAQPIDLVEAAATSVPATKAQ